MSLTFISLFSGIGGIDLGLERSGMTCVAQVEIDPYAQKVLAKHWPHVIRHSDVRTVGATNLPNADVVAGGFPCQEISDAGQRTGLEGQHSGLWSEYARIVHELRPKYVFVENVAALLRRGMGRVLGDLAAIGYDAEWECIPAAALGAPHLRARIWLLAYPRGLGGEARRDDTIFAGRLQSQLRPRWPTEPALVRVVDGFPRPLDRLRGLGNAALPQIAELIGRHIAEHASH